MFFSHSPSSTQTHDSLWFHGTDITVWRTAIVIHGTAITMKLNYSRRVTCVYNSKLKKHNITEVPERGRIPRSATSWGGSGGCWRGKLRRTLSRRLGCGGGPTERRRRMWSRTPGNTRPALSHSHCALIWFTEQRNTFSDPCYSL